MAIEKAVEIFEWFKEKLYDLGKHHYVPEGFKFKDMSFCDLQNAVKTDEIPVSVGWVAHFLADRKRNMIFCDGIELGKQLAHRFNLESIYSSTKKRLQKIHEAIIDGSQHALVTSRVKDEGVSLAKIERIIEFNFLFGSRRQEMQRLDRLFHSDYEGEHIILMTQEEHARRKKRLCSIYEKGFQIKVHA